MSGSLPEGLRGRALAVAVTLAAATLALYWPVRHFDLIYFDDPLILKDTPEVQAGLTWSSFKWAWTSVVIANWQPLTNLSFLVVAGLFGSAPGPHRTVSGAALAHWRVEIKDDPGSVLLFYHRL